MEFKEMLQPHSFTRFPYKEVAWDRNTLSFR